jgi:uncharacterized RDD family membrane protein YckC
VWPISATTTAQTSILGERCLAWLVDVVVLTTIMAPLSVLTWLGWPGPVIVPRPPLWVPFINFGLSNTAYLLYWAFMEGLYGRSLGKMLMRLKVTRLNAEPIDMGQAALESVGKAFLLPLDLILGWILRPRERQRMFNYLSRTIVLRA